MRERKERVLAEEAVLVPATAEHLADLHASLERFWTALDQAPAAPPDSAWRARFATAVAEIGANIIRHAHPAGTRPGPMRLQLRAYDDRVEAQFTDQGVAYEPKEAPPAEPASAGGDGAPAAAAPDAGAMADLLALPEGGYGLALVRAAVDRLEYARTPGGENRWRLVKRVPAPA